VIDIEMTLLIRNPHQRLKPVTIQLPVVPRAGETIAFLYSSGDRRFQSGTVSFVSYTMVDGKAATPAVAITVEVKE
jgi:hypothetical protein